MKVLRSITPQKYRKRLFILAWALTLSLFIAPAAFAQKTISGTVYNSEDQLSLPGASVVEKGTTNGALCDLSGHYEIKVKNEQSVLVFSMIGFETQEINVGQKTVIDISLISASIGIEGVVVVGYGTQRKKDVSGAIENVSIKELQKFSNSNTSKALQGLAAGVYVENTSGAPGATATIQIRGVGTFGNFSPLVIVDGVESSLDRVDPDDIESFSVLKDGAAAAIYGSKAANGVMLIVTKKGKSGEPVITLDVDHTINVPLNFWPMLSSNSYVDIAKKAYTDAGIVIPGYLNNYQQLGSTDWMKTLTDNGHVSRYRFNVSGGGEYVSYDFSATLNKEDGVMIASDLTTPVIRGKIDMKKNHFKSGIVTNIRQQKGQTFTSTGESALMDVIQAIPLGKPKDENGNWVGYLGTGADKKERTNPLFNAQNPDKQYKNNIYEISGYAEYEILKGLNLRSVAAYSNEDFWNYFFSPKYDLNSHTQQTYDNLSESRSNFNYGQLNATLTYDTKIGKHSFNLLAGYEAKEGNYRSLSIVGEDFLFSDLRVPQNIRGSKDIQGSAYSESYISQFGRLNYDYANKYYLSATFRRDGSSKFSPDYRYGTFPSVSMAWRISNEEFMKNASVISDLKLRLSYGKLGNDQVDNYSFQNRMYSAVDYEGTAYVYNSGYVAGYTVMQLANTDVRWETKESKNIGIDLGLMKNKIEIKADYFVNKTIDLITDRLIPGSVGVWTSVKSNFGTMKNSGWEFSATYRNSEKAFVYSAMANLSAVKNEVVILNNSDDPYREDGWVDYSIPMTRTVEGEAMGRFYLYSADGLFQNQQEVDDWNKQGSKNEAGEFVPLQPNAKPGDVRFVDINHDGILDSKDKSFVGSPWPKFEYSLVLNAAYKGFDITMNMGGVQGNKILNGLKFNTESLKRFEIYNMSQTLENAWTPENTNTTVPRLTTADLNENNRPSTLYLENGSYFRMRLLQIGYSVPKEVLAKLKIGLTGIRIYSSASNLFTFTKYTGPSPEVSSGGNFEKGVDRGYYPLYKSFMFGLQVKF